MNVPILPLAVTMMAGPQEMTAIILVTHRQAVRASVAFLIGVTAAMLLGTTIAFLLAGAVDLGDASDNGSTGHVIQYALVALLVVLVLRTYRTRENVEPPKWLGKLQEASIGRAFTMGFLLILVFPTDVATMLTVGVNLQQEGDSLIDAGPFWLLTFLIAALPFLTYVAFGDRAKQAMPRVRDWMADHAWVINIAVLCLFIVMILS